MQVNYERNSSEFKQTNSVFFNEVITALENHGCKPKQNGDGYAGFCPVHESNGHGHKPSLSIKRGDKQAVILHCHAGCPYEAITAALGLERPKNGARQPIATYSYCDADGVEVRQKLRYEPKDFRIRHQGADGQWVYKAGSGAAVLYRLPQLRDALESGETVWIVEGEKDADRLAGLGLAATCNIEGAASPGQKTKWRTEYTAQLKGAARVVLLPDNDDPGRAHMKAIAAALKGKVGAVVTLELPGLPAKGDVSDWLNVGHTLDELRALADAGAEPAGDAPEWFSDVDDAPTFNVNDPRLQRNKKGGVIKSLSNAITVCTNLFPGLIAYNEFRQRIEARISTPWRKTPGAWTDRDTVELADAMSRRYFPDFSSEKLHSAILAVAHRNPFNPAQDRLRSLAEMWDGVPRLDSWLTKYLAVETTADNDAYLKEIGAAWMKGTAARVQFPGCKRDDVLVFRGPQGWFKSTAAQAIADEIAPDAFTDSLGNLEGKDAKSAIRGIIIAELGELAALSKSSIESTKSFVAAKSDHFREAYGKLERDFPRTVSFIGTTNDERFLKDPTGNRRWWPVTLTQPIDIERFRAILPQLLGEATRRVLDGEAWHVSNRAALQQAETIRGDHFDHDVWTDGVLNAADAMVASDGYATIAGILEKMAVPTHLQNTSSQIRVGGILRIAGWSSKRRRVCRRLIVSWTPQGVHPIDVHPSYRVNTKGDTQEGSETAGVQPVSGCSPYFTKRTNEKEENATANGGEAEIKNTLTEVGCTGGYRLNTPSNSGDSSITLPVQQGEQAATDRVNTLEGDAQTLWNTTLRYYRGAETAPRLAQKTGLGITRTLAAAQALKARGMATINGDLIAPVHLEVRS